MIVKGSRFAVAGVLTCSMVLATGGAASAEDASCTASGSGTTWDLAVEGPSTPVGGYVAGFPGGTIKDFSINGFSGQPDTTGLPSGISNGLFTQIPSGRDVVLRVITSAPPTGAFNVAFINTAQTAYGPLFACPFDSGPAASGPGSGSAGLTVAVGDVNGDGSPDLLVQVAGPGDLRVRPIVARIPPNANVKLVTKGKVAVTKAGKVTVPLRATDAGKGLLAQKGAFTTRIKVTFTPSDGKSTSKTVQVTFKKK